MSPTLDHKVNVEQIDLSSVLECLQTKEKFSVTRANHAITQYRRFLGMIQANPKDIMVPNEDVDMAWHHHILDTEAYIQDCQSLFGQYLHHNPHFYGTDAFFKACDKTQLTYEKEFGHRDVFLKQTTSVKGPENSAYCGGMLKDDVEASGKPAYCGGMLKDDVEASGKPAYCGGMLKDDTAAHLKPSHNSPAALFQPYENNLVY